MTDPHLRNIWYFGALSGDLARGKMRRVIIANEPINLGRNLDGEIFAMRDICPHRAAPLSKGCIKDGSVECPYHGWRFGIDDGVCREIPSLAEGASVQPDKIKVATYPVQETGALIWIWLGDRVPDVAPPDIPLAAGRPIMNDELTLNCHLDHAAFGLIDPAHGPHVHRQWWWRTEKSRHEKNQSV